jgi:hypothetical protein
MRESCLNAETLREILAYTPETGLFTWKIRPSAKVKQGSLAGALEKNGYLRIGISGKMWSAHRLAWLYVFGRWPRDCLDHINGDRADNRVYNLRECNYVQNGQNRASERGSTSSFVGVSWDKDRRKWRACIRAQGKNISLGYHSSEEGAAHAYAMAKSGLHTFNPEVRETA